jgi:N4-(beta-N-acetylglucosaminyl)-L-asparaginase
MKPGFNRRSFLAATAAASMSTLAIGAAPQKPAGKKRPVIVCSGNGAGELDRGMKLLKDGADPLDVAIEVVAGVEANPNDHSVGLGGMPNENGVVELDASVMHGPTHGGAGVAALRNIVHPAAVARLVMQRSRHSLLVGEGALEFARAHGFPEVDLLTDEARQIWLHWKETRDANDNWLPPPPSEKVAAIVEKMARRPTTGTIHCSVLDTHGDLGCCTTTSGWGFKLPGRVGDSPILGAGLFLDNEVGSCGSTGLGEVNLLNCSSYLIIDEMRRGKAIKDALVAACKHIIKVTARNPRYRDADGKPANYGLTFYAIDKAGNYAGANLFGPASFEVHDGDEKKRVECEVVTA